MDTGAEGGKKTGEHMSHHIEVGGVSECACAELVKLGFEVPDVELWSDGV